MGEARSGGHHFPVGSVVEVLDKEAGVHLVSTVVPPPRNIEPENEGKLYVRYRYLPLRRGRSGRLREFVDVSSVRPTPPPHKASKRFELNDVVEAYHIGGWWEGVVTAVSDGGEKLVVTFENPPEPDELRFARSNLRPLWDWVDGVWTWPQRKGENGALKVGKKVEVSIDCDLDFDFDFDFDFRVAWFPAVIVRNLGNGVYSVKLKDKNVKCVGIRPSPPVLDDGEFRVGEKVDAFFDCGWWTGFIIKKVKMNEYIVLFEDMNSTKQLNRSELRPHLEWKDGKWLIHHDGAASSSPKSKRKRKSSFSSLKRHKPQTEYDRDVHQLIDEDSRAPNEETEHIDKDGDDIEYNRDVQQLIDEDSRAPNEETEHIDKDGDDIEYNRDVQQLIDEDSRAPNEETEHIDKDGDDIEYNRDVQQLIDEDSRAPNEETEHIDKDGDDIEYNRDVQQLINEDSRAPNKETEHIDKDGDDVEYDHGVQQLINEDSRAPNKETEHIDKDGDDVEYDHGVQQLNGEDSISRAPNEDSVQQLPFVKRNAIWKSIEWTEVLQRMPHFEPLRAFRENQREGLAIACMVTFTNMVEASRRLKLTDPKSEMDDIQETLVDLETFGFHVGEVRERVTKLLKAKEEAERLDVEAKGILEQIETRSMTRERVEREMREMNMHIGRLQERLKLAEVEEEKEVEEIGRLQARLEKNQKQVESLRSDFEASVSNGD
ncbi:DUF724 domain-containing protein 3-like isoform X2 [Salvia splendens]|uniref:DUF724 domain-containing protein 3-like isoform X2 n=1 Tax=Salvia splendens TaxID=180675 RepID=UPI001C2798A2|nr:DUF724 domain-containing protein 3-like isoform X2 [Salvia splendens]